MRKNVITGVSLVALSAGMAQAGGFELQTLDTSIMYADRNTASISYARIDASIKGYTTAAGAVSNKEVVKDQTVNNLNAKFDVGDNFSFGLSTYHSGSVQLSGGNGDLAAAGNITPIADIKLQTTALMVNYQLNENMSFIGGMTNNSLEDSSVSTLAGDYTVSGATAQGYIVGAAYSVPEIALRAEVTYQPKTELKTTADFVGSTALGGATRSGKASSVSLPDTLALSFQTGIAADTLLTASYRKSAWSKAQITSTVFNDAEVGALAALAGANIKTEFEDSESFSIGIGRKFSDTLSGSLTYANEEGSSKPATSLFTVSNGSEAISLGLQYKTDDMTISGGISQRNVGDVTVNHSSGTMRYSGNTVTSIGLKIAFAF